MSTIVVLAMVGSGKNFDQMNRLRVSIRPWIKMINFLYEIKTSFSSFRNRQNGEILFDWNEEVLYSLGHNKQIGRTRRRLGKHWLMHGLLYGTVGCAWL